MIKFSKRPLTEIESNILYEEIKQTPNIIGYTRKELQNFRESIIAIDGEEFVGACISFDLSSNWTEIAVLYVLKKYRKKGIGKMLFNMTFQETAKRNRLIYTVSRNPLIINLMREKQMIFKNIFNLPLEILLNNIKYLINPYHLVEFLRKAVKFNNILGWKYAIKHY